MAKSKNYVELLGYVGKDPEVKAIPSGAKVAKFSIATSESWVDKNTNQRQEKTEWHNLVAWRGTAEIIEKYVSKGSHIMVEGKLSTRSWEDQNGQKRYMTEVVVDQIYLLGGKNDGRNTSVAGQGQAQSGYGPAAPAEDGLPF